MTDPTEPTIPNALEVNCPACESGPGKPCCSIHLGYCESEDFTQEEPHRSRVLYAQVKDQVNKADPTVYSHREVATFMARVSEKLNGWTSESHSEYPAELLINLEHVLRKTLLKMGVDLELCAGYHAVARDEKRVALAEADKAREARYAPQS